MYYGNTTVAIKASKVKSDRNTHERSHVYYIYAYVSYTISYAASSVGVVTREERHIVTS